MQSFRKQTVHLTTKNYISDTYLKDYATHYFYIKKAGQLMAHRLYNYFNAFGLLYIKAIRFHHLHPRVHKVFYEFIFRIITRIHFGQGAKFGVRTKD